MACATKLTDARSVPIAVVAAARVPHFATNSYVPTTSTRCWFALDSPDSITSIRHALIQRKLALNVATAARLENIVAIMTHFPIKQMNCAVLAKEFIYKMRRNRFAERPSIGLDL